MDNNKRKEVVYTCSVQMQYEVNFKKMALELGNNDIPGFDFVRVSIKEFHITQIIYKRVSN